MAQVIRILHVEDSNDDSELLVRQLRKDKIEVEYHRVETAEQMEKALNDREWDVVISDYALPRFSGVEALGLFNKKNLAIPFLLVSGTIGEETTAKIIKAGAHDYLMKDNLDRLSHTIEREMKDAQVRAKHQKTQAQLLHAQKMEAVGRLAGGIAHDFNNILAVIISYSENLLETLPGESPAVEGVQQIKTAAEQAALLTRQLLTFSRKQEPLLETLDLNFVINDTRGMLDRLIGEDVILHTQFAASPAIIRCDRTQLVQIIMNLAVNARDAMPKGGKLTIRTEKAGGQMIRLSVTDTGQGMSKETLSRIFEPFFTTKSQGKGTGLGLPVVYGIVEQLGGKITVESKLGVGTEFNIELPLVGEFADTPKSATDKLNSTDGLGGTETVILVEDNPPLRKVLAKRLRENGYNVLEAGDGKEALQIGMSHKGEISIVVTDVVMPQMGGPELIEKLKAHRPQVRPLYISGYVNDAASERGFKVEDSNFLQKPFSALALLQKIRAILK